MTADGTVTVEINICKRCGYKWQPRVKDPRTCPACKSHKWTTSKKQGTTR